jgi:hypothetical protein
MFGFQEAYHGFLKMPVSGPLRRFALRTSASLRVAKKIKFSLDGVSGRGRMILYQAGLT